MAEVEIDADVEAEPPDRQFHFTWQWAPLTAIAAAVCVVAHECLSQPPLTQNCRTNCR